MISKSYPIKIFNPLILELWKLRAVAILLWSRIHFLLSQLSINQHNSGVLIKMLLCDWLGVSAVGSFQIIVNKDGRISIRMVAEYKKILQKYATLSETDCNK